MQEKDRSGWIQKLLPSTAEQNQPKKSNETVGPKEILKGLHQKPKSSLTKKYIKGLLWTLVRTLTYSQQRISNEEA